MFSVRQVLPAQGLSDYSGQVAFLAFKCSDGKVHTTYVCKECLICFHFSIIDAMGGEWTHTDKQDKFYLPQADVTPNILVFSQPSPYVNILLSKSKLGSSDAIL